MELILKVQVKNKLISRKMTLMIQNLTTVTYQRTKVEPSTIMASQLKNEKGNREPLIKIIRMKKPTENCQRMFKLQ